MIICCGAVDFAHYTNYAGVPIDDLRNESGSCLRWGLLRRGLSTPCATVDDVNAKYTETHARPIKDLVPPFPSEDWLSRRLNKGIIPGSKLGRNWVMTDADILAALEIFHNSASPADTRGLTAAGMRRSAR